MSCAGRASNDDARNGRYFSWTQCYLPMRWNCAPMHGKAEEELVSRSRCEPIHNVLWTPVERRGLAEQRCMQCGRDSLEMISLD